MRKGMIAAFIIGIVLISGCSIGGAVPAKANNAPELPELFEWHRHSGSAATILVDKHTQCQYIILDSSHSMSIRYDADGKPMCGKNTFGVQVE